MYNISNYYVNVTMNIYTPFVYACYISLRWLFDEEGKIKTSNCSCTFNVRSFYILYLIFWNLSIISSVYSSIFDDLVLFSAYTTKFNHFNWRILYVEFIKLYTLVSVMLFLHKKECLINTRNSFYCPCCFLSMVAHI